VGRTPRGTEYRDVDEDFVRFHDDPLDDTVRPSWRPLPPRMILDEIDFVDRSGPRRLKPFDSTRSVEYCSPTSIVDEPIEDAMDAFALLQKMTCPGIRG